MESIVITPIGIVRSPRTDRGDDHWGRVESTIVIDADQFSPDTLVGLGDFSHIEVLYRFHGISSAAINTTSRSPRNNPRWPIVGIFAQRGSGRPNLLGVSRCRVVSIGDLTITVLGLDAIDGTPVLDVKPYMREFGPRGDVRQPAWVGEVMENYYS